MDRFEQIEKYLQDKMDVSERSAFEAKIAADDELLAEVNTIRDLILGVESYQLRDKLKGKKIGELTVDSIDSSGSKTVMKVSQKTSDRFSFRYLAVAASIIGVCFAGWWMMQEEGRGSQDMLFAQAFYTDPGLPTPMSETNNYAFYDAMVDYKMEKYDIALAKWENVTTGIGKDTLAYYKGVSHLKMKNLTEAMSELQSISASSPLSDKAHWSLIGIYIKTKEYAKAKELINQLPTSTSPKYEEIKSFLESK